ncbi:MAG: FkbM family methyltransferase [Candidatus Korobacteraceae bacterium]|jgi:FkbM family methyltransferase
MAQISRAVKTGFLLLCPASLRAHLLETRPNLRKAAPAGMRFLFPSYLGDISVHIDTTYKVERIMWTGEYEAPLIRFLQTHSTDGWICFDVGANVGAVALALAKYAGDSGKVFAFEPGPPNMLRLQGNLSLNRNLLARTEALACGVADRPGEFWWAEEPGNPGNALLSDKGTHKVQVMTLDAFIGSRQFDRVDFVKIDVEGMEFQVMRGATELLRRFRPIMYFETLSRYVSSGKSATFADIQQLLAGEFGYRLYRISSSGQLSPMTGSRHGGYTVAVHPERPVQPRL